MSENQPENNKKLTEEELEAQINKTYDILSKNQNNMFELFAMHNDKFKYMPLTIAKETDQKLKEARSFISYSILTATAIGALGDIAYLRKKTSKFPLLLNIAIRFPYYYVAGVVGYGFGYFKKMEPVNQDIKDVIDDYNLDFSKYRKMYRTLYENQLGKPLTSEKNRK